MKLKIKAGSTSYITRVRVKDSSSLIGDDLAGLLYNSTGLVAYYSRIGETGSTQITLVDTTLGTFTSGGFKAVDGTNMPGIYEFHIPNAALAAGSKGVHIVLRGATNMVPVTMEIELDAIDYQTQIPDQILGAMISGFPAGGTVGSGLLSLSQNIYYADIELIPDRANSQDEYGVQWFRNAQPLNSGQISNPAFSVYDGQTGTALLTNRILNYASPVLGVLSKTETTLTASGVPYLVVASGLIDGGIQNWQNVVGKE